MEDILGVADLPVIFLFAYGREDQIARALDMGLPITSSALLVDGAFDEEQGNPAAQGGPRGRRSPTCWVT